MKTIFNFVLLIFSVSLWANENSCDDYLTRHYRQDLRPTSVYYSNAVVRGRPVQIVKLRLKNTGEVDMRPEPNESNHRTMYVRVGLKEVSTQLLLPVDSGQQTTVTLVLPKNSLQNCGKATFAIDTRHTVGQWGCLVWNNDSAELVTPMQGRFCRNFFEN